MTAEMMCRKLRHFRGASLCVDEFFVCWFLVSESSTEISEINSFHRICITCAVMLLAVQGDAVLAE